MAPKVINFEKNKSKLMLILKDFNPQNILKEYKSYEELYNVFLHNFDIKNSQSPKNLWLGITVENGNHLDRLEDLRHCPGWHFVSIEPCLDAVVLPNNPADYLNWVIVGCETGPGARIDENTNKNIDSIVDQCLDARLPFWVKARAEYKNGKWTYTHDVPKELRQYPEDWMKGGLK